MAAVSMYQLGGAFDTPRYSQPIYDTSKSSCATKWSSKTKPNGLAKTKSGKNVENQQIYETISSSGGSALSKSMKYAESWLYSSSNSSTMRSGMYSPYAETPLLISTSQKPTPHNYAVILCSCPDYLNGTKKVSSSKVSICKKCKGSRLPLAIAESPRLLIGGTVRGSQLNREPVLFRSGTVKVQNSKSRPTILHNASDADPYDMMRRSRLAPPIESRVGSQFSTTRLRAKSISPNREKSVRNSSDATKHIRSKSIGPSKEVWVTEDETIGGKKSILSCEINPYDLIKSENKNKILENVDLSNEYEERFHNVFNNTTFKPITKSKSENNVKAISGQRIYVTGSIKAKNTSDATSVKLAPKNDNLQTSMSLPNIRNAKMFSKKTLSLLGERRKLKCESPKRPPRKIRSTKHEEDSESDHASSNGKIKISYGKNQNIKIINKNIDSIKSILKKPNMIENQSDNNTINSQFHFSTPKGDILLSQNILRRKRVQFMVEKTEETKVIYTADLGNDSNIMTFIKPLDEHENYESNFGQQQPTNILENSKNLEINNSNENNCCDLSKTPIQAFDENFQKNIVETGRLDEPKSNSLRRCESERLSITTTYSAPKFLDTMALRIKSRYEHSSQIFSSKPNKNENNVFTITTNQVLEDSENPYGSDILSDENDIITNRILSDLRRSIVISPEPPPRSRTKAKSEKKNNYEKTRFIRLSSSSCASDDLPDVNCVDQKTVLEIKQNDKDDDKTSYQMDNGCNKTELPKTSICITVDDCSAQKLQSESSPIYLSTVFVRDENENTSSSYQNGTTVTINVGGIYNESSKSNSQVYISESSQNIETENKSNNALKEDLNKNKNNDTYHEKTDLSLIIQDPVEAVKRNLIPHVCGKSDTSIYDNKTELLNHNDKQHTTDFVTKLFDDPFFGHLAEGLDSSLVKKLIENSLMKLQESKLNDETKEDDIEKLIESSLSNIKNNVMSATENRKNIQNNLQKSITSYSDKKSIKGKPEKLEVIVKPQDDCSAPYESMEYESSMVEAFSDGEVLSDCYNTSTSELSTEDDNNSTRSKFYQMLVDAAICDIEVSNADDDHLYETIRINSDPIYEEINDVPPPLPSNPPPVTFSIADEDKKYISRSIFEGASKYDILSYLVDAKERGIDEETYITNYNTEEEPSKSELLNNKLIRLSTNCQISNISDSSEENSLTSNNESLEKSLLCKKSSADIERNDSGVGSETSKSSRSRLQGKTSPFNKTNGKETPIHLCEDCDTAVDMQTSEDGVIYAPLVCRKCAKKRSERKEIITEIVETEEKYGRDLQIILEEFYKPMLVAGLLTQEQLSAIFLNVEELIENNQVLSEKLRDALEIAVEQGDEDLLTVNVGKILLECSGMLTAFQFYCVKQAGAALLLSGLEKEKELLRIFLRVSQMENAVLRRMNLNSFLMVPVQRVTKYPLLLSRLYRATAACAAEREDVRAAQRCVESRLEDMNSAAEAAAAAARDVPLWRRLAAAKRTAHDLHVADIRLRKMAVDVLDWNHDEARFAMEGKLLFTQPNDNNWRRGRTIKLAPINALLVTNGKPTSSHKAMEIRETREARDREAREKDGEALFARSGVREAALLLVREKAGRYTLQREPLYLDRCVVAADHEPEHFFEVHEITTKDSYIFKAEENARTRTWYRQLQYHAQGAGAWRKRRNALANIMINPMLTRN